MGRNDRVLVDFLEYLVEDPDENVETALITPHWVTVMVMTIEDREADTDQRSAGIALQILAVGVADQEVHRLREEQRTHVPKVAQRIDVAILAEGVRVQHGLNLFGPFWRTIGRQNMGWFATALHEEFRKTDTEIRIAVDREFLAVNMGA